MARLPETTRAIASLRTDLTQEFGMHVGQTVMHGVPGLVVGEERFDPSRHPVSAINPLSMMELGLDSPMPYVRQVLPYKTLEMNVVVHDDSGDYEMPEWLEPVIGFRDSLAVDTKHSIEASKQVGDKVNLFVVGNPARPSLYGREAEVVKNTEQPEAAAQAVADIARSGLSFIISDFNRLPLHRVSQANFKRSVGVKANHPIELEFPANTGVWPLGGGASVDTGNRRELKSANKGLQKSHAQIAANIGQAGLAHLQVVYDNQFRSGLDREAFDRPLATILRRMSGR